MAGTVLSHLLNASHSSSFISFFLYSFAFCSFQALSSLFLCLALVTCVCSCLILCTRLLFGPVFCNAVSSPLFPYSLVSSLLSIVSSWLLLWSSLSFIRRALSLPLLLVASWPRDCLSCSCFSISCSWIYGSHGIHFLGHAMQHNSFVSWHTVCYRLRLSTFPVISDKLILYSLHGMQHPEVRKANTWQFAEIKQSSAWRRAEGAALFFIFFLTSAYLLCSLFSSGGEDVRFPLVSFLLMPRRQRKRREKIHIMIRTKRMRRANDRLPPDILAIGGSLVYWPSSSNIVFIPWHSGREDILRIRYFSPHIVFLPRHCLRPVTFQKGRGFADDGSLPFLPWHCPHPGGGGGGGGGAICSPYSSLDKVQINKEQSWGQIAIARIT